MSCIWMKDGFNITNNCNDMWITNVSRRDTGEYKCMAANEYGLKESRPVYLDVYCK